MGKENPKQLKNTLLLYKNNINWNISYVKYQMNFLCFKPVMAKRKTYNT